MDKLYAPFIIDYFNVLEKTRTAPKSGITARQIVTDQQLFLCW